MVSISVIVPVYNGEAYISECLEMIINQTFKNFEVIVVNDGSTDNTRKICEKYLKDDSRIKLINNKKSGTWHSRNIAIESAVGKYIIFLDCDDYYSDKLLEVMYNHIENYKCDLVISGCEFLYVKNGVIKEREKIVPKVQMFESNQMFLNNYTNLKKQSIAETLWNKIYKAQIIKDNNIKFKNFRRGEDVIFNLDYYKYVNKCKITDDILYGYIIDKDNPWWIKYSENLYEVVLNEYKAIIERISKWNLTYNYNEYEATLFMKGILGYFRWVFYSKNIFSVKYRYMKIKYIVMQKDVQEAIKLANPNKMHQKLLVSCITNKRIILIMFITRIKIILKKLINIFKKR